MSYKFILGILFSVFCFNSVSSAREVVQDIRWDNDKGILSYKLSQDSVVKIRAGSEKGGVYRTLVNLEKRAAGKNKEEWDGKDESETIDFTRYAPLHFCVDIPANPKKDFLLSVDVRDKRILQKGMIVSAGKTFQLTLDMDANDKKTFLQGKIEIMTFLDNRLVKLDRTEKLPHTITVDLRNASLGKHLLTLNAWPQDHSSAAYKNLFVILRDNKTAESEITKDLETDKQPSILNKIAYCQRHKGFWQVWTANLDGTNARPITETMEDKRYPDFSPDGRQIAYVTNTGQLWIMDVTGENSRKITLPLHVSCPRWSKDGKKIAFVSYQDLYHGDSEIWEVEMENLSLKKLTSRPWMQYDPSYSPDGKNLIFTDGPELYAQEIRKLNLETDDVIQLTDNQPYDYDMQPVYSSDAELIVYSSNETGNYDIWVIDKFGQKKRNITVNPAHDYMPRISADGKHIFFLSDRSGEMEVWRIDINGNNLTEITKDNKDKQDLNVYTSN